ncbi:hypothetical protein [Pelomonas saccharophila]|uniref:Uncharacterized protein n=2 Tax=Roseateles saccharophilus TaxID=304 RepID=A0A4R3VC86_ROSSA|nr:hypothetical protein EV671_1006168 [Roseateles saccharophilus]
MLAALHFPAHAYSGVAAIEPQIVDDSTLKPRSVAVGGATVLPTTRTIPHWWGSMTDPTNGASYGYNMVGANPYSCAGPDCTVVIQVDIVPLIVNIGGLSFSGSDVLAPTLASPVFQGNDYGATLFATAGAANHPRGPGGLLSQGDAGQMLQLQDATMRAQFNQAGQSSYHLILLPNVLPAVTISVPANQGTLRQSGRGVVFADVDIGWWSSQINNLRNQADPTHLAMFLTDNVMLYDGNNPSNCCVIGYHGTKATGNGGGSTNSNGNAEVQTFVWASWVQPGLFARPNGGTSWALQDIHALSHEIAEWADDPFVNNAVQPWLTPTAPQYGCTTLLETGDPVVGIGFAMGVNTYQQGSNPNGTQSADGYYHPEDEVFLPWFLRTAPNTVSEPTQSASANIGRYTLMGDLNPFPGFRAPATGCQ